MNESNNILTIKTVQIQPIRYLISALKDILTDATITFTPTKMSIVNFDKSQTILVNVSLNAHKFETYSCLPDNIIIGVDTIHLFKVLSTMTNDDVLTIFIDKNDYHDGIVSHLGLQFEDGNIGQCYNQRLKLIEPDMTDMIVPQMDYTTVINLPAAYFQKIIRNSLEISDRLEIKSVGDDLIFSCEGKFASLRICRSAASNVEGGDKITFVQKPANDIVIQGEFSLKRLNDFTKCTPLCTHLEIYLANDMPLIVKYFVATIGEIKLCLAQLPPK